MAPRPAVGGALGRPLLALRPCGLQCWWLPSGCLCFLGGPQDGEKRSHSRRPGPSPRRRALSPAGRAAPPAELPAEPPRRQGSGPAAAASAEEALPDAPADPAKHALLDARAAAARGQLLRAQNSAEELSRLPGEHGAPDLEQLPAQLDRVHRLLQSSSRKEADGWRRFDLDFLTLWRRWDSESRALTVFLGFEAKGSMVRQIAALRDVELAEEVWDGACWDMWSQHTGCVSLVRWLQKDPFTKRKTEVIMERVFCDCLDWESCPPCWVVLERSPDIKDFAKYSGMWGPFDIPAPPPGFIRGVATESGRILEPIGPDRCQVTMTLTLHLPAVIRGILTDSLLAFAVRVSSKSTRSSWERLMEGWGATGFEERVRGDRAFYGALEERVRRHLS